MGKIFLAMGNAKIRAEDMGIPEEITLIYSDKQIDYKYLGLPKASWNKITKFLDRHHPENKKNVKI